MTSHSKVAVVTGASRGLGREIALCLGEAGFAVAATARRADALGDVVTAITERGGRARGFIADVTDEASVTSMAAEVGRWGAVHTVVANAGVAGPTAPMQHIGLPEWRSTIVSDLDSVFLTFKAFIPDLIERRAGSLVAISSMTGKRPMHGRTPYSAAKMGVIGLVRTLATELGPHGIRVNAVCPGGISGERIDQVILLQAQTLGITEADALASFTEPSPLKRMVTACEVAATCAFLASDGSAAITGEDLNVSAGVVMY